MMVEMGTPVSAGVQMFGQIGWMILNVHFVDVCSHCMICLHIMHICFHVKIPKPFNFKTR